MLLTELFDTEHYSGYKTEKLDNTKLKITDVRKTRLTLEQINRLRIMRDVREREYEKKLIFLKQQYGGSAEETGPSF